MSNLPVPRPPIAEAIFDIQVELPPTVDVPSLEAVIVEDMKREYPELRKQFVQEHKIQTQGAEPSVSEMKSRFRGFQFVAEGGVQIVQFRAEGYTFNRMPPYTSFDDYVPEVKRTWDLYRKHCRPVVIRRVALRYINRIVIPMVGGIATLDDYLVHGPHFPGEDEMMLGSFTHQQFFVEKATGLCANLTLAAPFVIESPQPDKTGEIILDIDTSANHLHLSPSASELWDIFERLRAFKNRLFECSLQPKCLDLFR